MTEPQPVAETEPAETEPPGKADLGTRALAFVIDVIVSVVLTLIPFVGGLVATAYWLVRDGLDVGFMNHRSIGKHVMSLRVETLDGSTLDVVGSCRRNWMFAISGIAAFLAQVAILGGLGAAVIGGVGGLIVLVEIYLVFSDPEGRRIGDNMANTKVVAEGPS